MKMKYYCKKCKRFHLFDSAIGISHKKHRKQRRNNITAYRNNIGDYDAGGSLKEHYKTDDERRGDWG